VTEDFEWADETCNPSEGCDKIAPEWEHCYAADVLDGDREQD
jgi:protein gp37